MISHLDLESYQEPTKVFSILHSQRFLKVGRTLSGFSVKEHQPVHMPAGWQMKYIKLEMFCIKIWGFSDREKQINDLVWRLSDSLKCKDGWEGLICYHGLVGISI